MPPLSWKVNIPLKIESKRFWLFYTSNRIISARALELVFLHFLTQYLCESNMKHDAAYVFFVCTPSPTGEPAPLPTSVAPPRDLVTSDITARSFRVKWTHAPGQVEKYRVVYYPASGGQPEEKVPGLLICLNHICMDEKFLITKLPYITSLYLLTGSDSGLDNHTSCLWLFIVLVKPV